jgi:adenine/guanine phosphoribosyltransferase-like PRPP-binding protein
MSTPREYCSWYLLPAFVDLKKNLSKARRLLKAAALDFDAVACRGVSGIVFASPLALSLGKPLIVVRKSGDGSHSNNHVECGVEWENVKRWLFVDDFISSGATMTEVNKALIAVDPKLVCAGRLLYSRMEVQTAETGKILFRIDDDGKLKKYS